MIVVIDLVPVQTDFVLQVLKHTPKLRSLEFRHCVFKDDRGSKSLRKLFRAFNHLPNLTSYTFVNIRKFPDGIDSFLAHCSLTRKLEIHSSLTSRAMHCITQMPNLTNLRLYNVSKTALKALSECRQPRLERFTAQHCIFSSSSGGYSFVSAMPNLTFLKITKSYVNFNVNMLRDLPLRTLFWVMEGDDLINVADKKLFPLLEECWNDGSCCGRRIHKIAFLSKCSHYWRELQVKHHFFT